MSELYSKMAEAVLEGQEANVVSLVNQALGQGISADDILNEGLMKGMDEVAVLFRDGEFFVPEVLMSAQAMQAGNNLLKPHLMKAGVSQKGTVVIGTVEGDLHDIGKKIVAMMLEGDGFKVVDLGVNVTTEDFMAAIEREQPNLLGMSAMLTTTMTAMPTVINELAARGYGDKVKVMVGGAPLSEAYAQKIGAHYSHDASAAITLANSLL